MPDLNLLVPGTGGTSLIDHTGADIGYPIRMRLGGATNGLLARGPDYYGRLLTMEHRPGQLAPVKTSALPGVMIRPGHVLDVAYNQVPAGFNRWVYDWRADLRYSAGQLLDVLRERKPSDGRWNLIGHSQGGLLIVLASKLLDDPEAFQEYVGRVVLVGAPLAGTVNAAHALLTGESAGKPSASVFKEILRTWPSLYQMLPQWPAVVDENGEELGEEHQLSSSDGWPDVPGIEKDFLERAADVMRMLRDPLSHMRGDVRVALVKARNRNTGVTLTRKDGALIPEPAARVQKGDGLVPFERTVTWIGDHIRPHIFAYNGVANAHAFMLTDPGISADVRRLLR